MDIYIHIHPNIWCHSKNTILGLDGDVVPSVYNFFSFLCSLSSIHLHLCARVIYIYTYIYTNISVPSVYNDLCIHPHPFMAYHLLYVTISIPIHILTRTHSCVLFFSLYPSKPMDGLVQPIPLGVTFSKAQSSKLERLFCHISVKKDIGAEL